MRKAPEVELRLAAIRWWKQRRPVEWTHRQHLANPTVNTTTPSEQRLARAVAKFVTRFAKAASGEG